jgi:hypothetical protein
MSTPTPEHVPTNAELQAEIDAANAATTALQERAKELVLEAEISKAARKLGPLTADAAELRLLLKNRVKYDDDGKPTNLDRALGEVVHQYPGLKPKPKPTTAQRIASMSAAEVEAAVAEIRHDSPNGAGSE